MRVNARFEGDAEAQIACLAQAAGMGVSDVLSASVQHYCGVVCACRVGLKHLSTFVGQGDSGRSDIAGSYKARRSKGWGDKHCHPSPAAMHESAPSWPAGRGAGGTPRAPAGKRKPGAV